MTEFVDEYLAVLQEMGITPLETHPTSHEPLVIKTLEVRTERQRHVHLPPSRPGIEIWEVDDDGGHYYVRDRTQEEFEEALAAYERAHKEWSRTCGISYTKGRTLIQARFVTEGRWWVDAYWRPESKDWWVFASGRLGHGDE